MITLLKFDYINHRNEPHKYEVIPIKVGFMRCKCFPNDPEKLSWGVRAACIRRDGQPRIVTRSFAFVKMTNMVEVFIEND